MAKLESVLNSDDRIQLDDYFHIDILISKIPTTRPKGQKKEPFLKGLKHISTVSRQICEILNTSKLRKNNFYQLCKRGILDLQSLVKNSNCVLIVLAFGIMLKSFHFDLKLSLSQFLEKHRFVSNLFLKTQFYPLIVDDLKQMNFWKLLDVVGREFKIRFTVYSGDNISEMSEVFTTDQFSCGPPIYIFLKTDEIDTHACLIFDLSSRSKKRKFWCYLCNQYFSTKKTLHKHSTCKEKKCFDCLRYDKLSCNIIEQGRICSKDDPMEEKSCDLCNRKFFFTSCYKAHFTSTCGIIRYCHSCKQYFKFLPHHLHKCGEIFCKMCFKYHTKDQNCRIYSTNPRISAQRIMFFDVHLVGTKTFALCIEFLSPNNSGWLFWDDMFYTFDGLDHEDIFDINLCHLQKQTHGHSPISYMLTHSQNMTVLLNQHSYAYLVNFALENYKENIKLFRNCFRIDLIWFKKLDCFLDASIYMLAYQNHLIPNLCYISPTFEEDMNSKYQFIEDDFKVEDKICGADPFFYKHIMQMKGCIQKLVDNKCKYEIFIQLKLYQAYVYCTSISKVKRESEQIFRCIGLPNISIFQFPSIAGFGFHFFLRSLPPGLVSVIPNKSPKTLKNSSKAELIFVTLLENLHSKVCDGRIYSLTNQNGEQFRVAGKLSLDFYCEKCHTGVNVEGNQKYLCLFHPSNNNQYFGQTKSNLFLEAQMKRVRAISKSSKIHRIITIGSCCISQSSPILNYVIKVFGKCGMTQEIKNKLTTMSKKFSPNLFSRLNFQDAILPNMSIPISSYCKHDGKTFLTRKYDQNCAHLQQILKDPYWPVGDPIFLTGSAAQKMWVQNIYNGKYLAFMKCLVTPPDHGFCSTIPFLPIPDLKGGSMHSLCRKCVQNNYNKSCDHTREERQFITTALSLDFIYAQDLGYKVVCLNMYYWPTSSKFENLTKNAEFLFKAIQTNKDNPLVKRVLKGIYQKGLGRFALRIDSEGCVEQVTSSQKLYLSILTKKCKSFDVYGKCVLMERHDENFNFSNHLDQCVKAKLWPFIFAFCSNSTRIDTHKKAIQCLTNNVILNRIDTDSVFLTCERSFAPKLNFLFPVNDYKIECDDVRMLISSKDKCYRYLSSNILRIVSPGLQLSVQERFSCDVFYKFKYVPSTYRIFFKADKQFELIQSICKGFKL